MSISVQEKDFMYTMCCTLNHTEEWWIIFGHLEFIRYISSYLMKAFLFGKSYNHYNLLTIIHAVKWNNSSEVFWNNYRSFSAKPNTSTLNCISKQKNESAFSFRAIILLIPLFVCESHQVYDTAENPTINWLCISFVI